MSRRANKVRSLISITFLILILKANIYSQGETNNWLLPRADLWLEFSSGQPQPVFPSYYPYGTSPVVDPYTDPYCTPGQFIYFFFIGYDNSASISDKNGNLLFSANGAVIFDKEFNWIYSNQINYREVATQSIFIPKPGNKNRYYYFTPSGNALPVGIYYTELDATLNAGFGGIVGTPDVLLTQPAANKITATYHANGKDVWLLTHEMASNSFKAFLVTKNGIDTVPIISNIGVVYQYGGSYPPIWNSSGGEMKFSPDGKKLLVSTCHINKVEVFDFDNNTGTLSNVTGFDFYHPLSIEFSPDGTVGYIGVIGLRELTGPMSNPSVVKDTNAIYQMDLMTNSSQIANTIYKVNPNDDFDYESNRMQLAYNGSIYAIDVRAFGFSSASPHTLNEIQTPNSLDSSCNFINESYDSWNNFPFPPYSPFSFRCLPSFFPPFLDRNILFDHNCYQDTVLICTQTNTNFDSIRWEFTDPVQGLISIPNQDTIYHEFPGFGPYEIFLKRYRNAGTEDIVRKMLYLYPKAIYNYPVDTMLCPGEDLQLVVSGDSAQFAWVNDFSTDTTFSNTVLISEAGKHWPIIQNFDEVCEDIDSIHVNYVLDNLDLGNDTSGICFTNSLLLDATVTGASGYTWSTNDTTPTVLAVQDGFYWVSVQHGSCVLQDTLFIDYDAPLPVDLPDTVFLCDSLPIMLFAGDFQADFLWSPNGETTADIFINSPGTCSVTASNGCGDFTDSTQAITLQNPTVNLGNDTIICLGESFQLAVQNIPFTNYLWSTGETGASITVFDQGWYSLSVTNECGDAADTINLTVHENTFAFPFDSLTLPSGQAITIDAGAGYFSYLWSTTQSIIVGSTGLYWVEVTDSIGCLGVDTVLLVRIDNIDTHDVFSQIKIYPNPVNNELTIYGLSGKQGKISLWNSLGQALIHIPTESFALSEGFGKAKINMSGLPEGIYLIMIKQGHDRKIFRVVKNRP